MSKRDPLAPSAHPEQRAFRMFFGTKLQMGVWAGLGGQWCEHQTIMYFCLGHCGPWGIW